MIVEVAIRNTRQKNLGYNAAVELNKRLIEDMNKNKNIQIDIILFVLYTIHRGYYLHIIVIFLFKIIKLRGI